MRTPRPLPPSARLPLTVRRARVAGLPAGRLRRADLEAPLRGVRWRRGTPRTPRNLAIAAAPLIPEGAVFSHQTAAILYGIPLPARFERSEDLHVTTPAPARAKQARGFAGHSRRLDPRERRVVSGVPVTSPARTWCDLAAILGTADLVAAGDHLLHDRERPALATRSELADALDGLPRGTVGVRRLREALPLLDGGSDSRRESLLRYELVTVGITWLQVNPTVHDRRGRRIGRVDLVDELRRTAIEYEGDQHRTDPAQWRRDVERHRRLMADGWLLIRVTASDDLRVMARDIARILATREPR